MIELDQAIARIFSAFAQYGGENYGEDVTQLQHALQCAQLARDHHCSDALIVAALLHDIGRMLDPDGNAIELQGTDGGHEDVGAQALGAVFPPAVTEPIRLHVAAKRYLCAVEPGYAETLSAGSKLSLAVQGGPATGEEVADFEREPFFADAVTLRRFDDWGKRAGCPVSELEHYRSVLYAVSRHEACS